MNKVMKSTMIRRAKLGDEYDIKRIQIEGWHDNNVYPRTGVTVGFLEKERGMILPPTEGAVEEIRNRISNKETNNYYVAVSDESVVGWIAGPFALDSGESGFGIYVDRRHRACGIGTELLRSFLTNRGEKRRAIEVTQSNKEGIKFYEKFGFKISEKRKHYFDDNHDEYLPVVVMRNYKLNP